MNEIIGEKKIPQKKLTSVDKPYLKRIPTFDYDYNAARKTALQFILDSAINYNEQYRTLPALNFYGRKISNGEFFDSVNIAGNAFLNIGVSPDDTVSVFSLNIPETFYTMYGLNDMGIATEWFNPVGMSVELLREHIQTTGVKVLVIIDIMYPIVKEAIKGTFVDYVIVTSVQDSFPLRMNMLYKIQVFGLGVLLRNPYYQHVIKEIDGMVPDERAVNDLTKKEEQQLLKHYQKIAMKINIYAKKEKIMEKGSFYCDSGKDNRFILWDDFTKTYGEKNAFRHTPYEEEKVKFIVHTGGTTGPAKRVAMTDFAVNSSVYQTTLMPFLDINYEDSFCQLVPPIVAYSLEGMHLARYYQMYTYLIATYDRDAFPKVMLKTRANHYFTVPSFAKTLIEDLSLSKKDFSFVKSLQHGGESISAEDDRKIDKIIGGKSRHGFGQNEEFGGIILNYDVPHVNKKYGCCGFPLIGTEYIIIDHETGEELPYGKDEHGNYHIGDLLISSDACMKSYLGENEIINRTSIVYRENKKYIVTGDQAYIDDEGRLMFWTREQRIIRTQQGKIFTNIIENILNNISEILECCVVKSPHPSNVSEVSCHIVLKPECWENNLDATIDKIISEVEAKTSCMYTYYVPGTYEFRKDRLPITPFGKIAYTELERQNEQEYRENNGLALKKIRKKL